MGERALGGGGAQSLEVLGRSCFWMKGMLGWEAGNRHELCNLLRYTARWAGGGGFRGPRSHSWNGGTWSQSWSFKINDPVRASKSPRGRDFKRSLLQSGAQLMITWSSLRWSLLSQCRLSLANQDTVPGTHGLSSAAPFWSRQSGARSWSLNREGTRCLALIDCEGLQREADVCMWLIVLLS